jgi:hypothetical protein
MSQQQMITAKTKKVVDAQPKDKLTTVNAGPSMSDSDSSSKLVSLDPETRQMLQTVVRIKKGKCRFEVDHNRPCQKNQGI